MNKFKKLLFMYCRLLTIATAVLIFHAHPILEETPIAFISTAQAADADCGGQPCQETLICSSNNTLICSDWNNGTFDGWPVSSNKHGSAIEPGIGLEGTRGWRHQITKGKHQTVFMSNPIPSDKVKYGPLYARMYIKFSPGYRFMQACGLQKMFYLESKREGTPLFRIMLGAAPARKMGGTYASLPDTVGIFGFDYIGHIVRYPNGPNDNPVLIYPDKWYAVEIMAHWTSRTVNVVKIWVDGQLQMSRENFNDGRWTSAHTFNKVQDTSWHGGQHPDCLPTQTQHVFKDNLVVATQYIGTIDGQNVPDEPDVPESPFAPQNLRVD